MSVEALAALVAIAFSYLSVSGPCGRLRVQIVQVFPKLFLESSREFFLEAKLFARSQVVNDGETPYYEAFQMALAFAHGSVPKIEYGLAQTLEFRSLWLRHSSDAYVPRDCVSDEISDLDTCR